MVIKNVVFAVLSLVLVAVGAAAQEKAAPPATGPTPLKLQVVFSRFQGEKRIASFPYMLSVNADDNAAKLRMGIDVPVRFATKEGAESFSFRNVGHNLDCSARGMADGRFRVNCSLTQSSIYSGDPERMAGLGAASPVPVGTPPMIRNFSAEAVLFLRNGETGQYTTATDPVSGETLKVDITLTVVK